MSLRAALLLPAFLVLAGCDTGATPMLGDALGEGDPFPAASDSCGASKLQGLIGQDASAANSALFTGSYRVLSAGESGGAMFRSYRTTVRLDAQDRIAKVQCG